MTDPASFVDAVLTFGLDSVGQHASAVANVFRSGADLRLLSPLLTSDDPDVICLAAWMASEAVDESRGREIFHELRALLRHPAPIVRLEAMGPVAQLVLPSEADVVVDLLGLLADENSGVRQRALLVVAAIPDSVFEAISRGEFAIHARWLTSGISRSEAFSAVASGDRLSERIALVSAARLQQPELLRELLQRVEPEVHEMLSLHAKRL